MTYSSHLVLGTHNCCRVDCFDVLILDIIIDHLLNLSRFHWIRFHQLIIVVLDDCFNDEQTFALFQ